MSDDAALLRRYAEEKSEAAFAELVHRHLDMVYAAALRRTGDSHRAQDVAQQVFTKLARNAGSLARHAVLGAWLHTATRNAALNLMISEQRRKARELTAVALGAGTADPVDWQTLRPVLDATIDELSAPDRAAVVARFLEQRPFAEIGSTLNVSEDAARMRVERALEKLRVLLGRRGISSTAAALGFVLAQQATVAAPAGLAGSVVTTVFSQVADAGTLTGLMTFMTGTKTTIALGIIAVAATVSALYQTQQAGSVADKLDTSRDEVTALRRQWTNLSAQTKEEENTLAALKAKAGESDANTAARETAANRGAAEAASLEKQKTDKALQQFLASDPELQGLKREERVQRAIRLLLPFGLGFGLTTEELDQVAAEFDRWGPVYLPIHESNLAGMPKRLASDPRFVEAWRVSDTRFAVENFNLTLWEPLNAAQAGQLIQSIQSARPDPIPPDGWNALGVQRTTDWAQVLAEAGRYLSPTQMTALRGFASSGRSQAILSLAAKQPRP